jgi:hypothetical protein
MDSITNSAIFLCSVGASVYSKQPVYTFGGTTVVTESIAALVVWKDCPTLFTYFGILKVCLLKFL